MRKKKRKSEVFVLGQNYVVLVFENLKDSLTSPIMSPVDPSPDLDPDVRPTDVISLTRVDRVDFLTFLLFFAFLTHFLLFLFFHFLSCYLLIFLVSCENYRKQKNGKIKNEHIIVFICILGTNHFDICFSNIFMYYFSIPFSVIVPSLQEYKNINVKF